MRTISKVMVATGQRGEEEGKKEKMRVIVEDQGEQIRLNHLLSNDLRGHTQLAAEPKDLDSGVRASVCA